MKVVFDSNVYVLTLATPGGVADRAIRAATEAAVEIFVSRPILEEVLGVMSRMFARAPEELARTALYLASLAEVVTPARRIDVLTDAPDNRVLECASAANADVIVTGDREMLFLGTWEGIEIQSLRQFVDRLAQTGGMRQLRARYTLPKRHARGRRAPATV